MHSSGSIPPLTSENYVEIGEEISKSLKLINHTLTDTPIGRYERVGKYFAVKPFAIDEGDEEKRNQFINIFENPNAVKFCEAIHKFLQLASETNVVKETVLGALFDEDVSMELVADVNRCKLLFQYLQECLDLLNNAGFYSVNGKPLNFWSGSDAKEKADTVLTSLSNSNVPAISVISGLGEILKEKFKQRSLSDKVFRLISALFASQAMGDAECYMTGSETEPPCTLTVNNIFWDYELSVLEKNKEKGKIQNNYVFFLDHKTGDWLRKKLFDENDSSTIFFAGRRFSLPNLSSEDNNLKRKKGPPREMKPLTPRDAKGVPMYLFVTRELSQKKEVDDKSGTPSPSSSPRTSLSPSPSLSPSSSPASVGKQGMFGFGVGNNKQSAEPEDRLRHVRSQSPVR